MERGGRRPRAEEVIAKLKDDGDFDELRLKIIRKVKENEELRNRIVMEVKQSVVLNEEGSEKLKLRQLSDGIYQELGSKIMGQISDEVWKVIKSNESDVRGTVESVYNRIVKPEERKEDRSSPLKQQSSSGKEDHASLTASTGDSNATDNGPQEPPGFAVADQQGRKSKEVEHKDMLHDQKPHSNKDELHSLQPVDDAVPPGFGPRISGMEQPDGGSDEDPDVPPGFG
ncbi:uncharacterized protein LOC103707611 [Phoenix dactylifera]|uniref:Uncharacterized protein LOC103707611 n=1 Tax=Phoenix dactylifera TaxID=42345 RepID=A0A8B7C2M1_PHODC|nr:uncharacterized protein LOC103707611 [Phoenix dactylifera]